MPKALRRLLRESRKITGGRKVGRKLQGYVRNDPEESAPGSVLRG